MYHDFVFGDKVLLGGERVGFIHTLYVGVPYVTVVNEKNEKFYVHIRDLELID